MNNYQRARFDSDLTFTQAKQILLAEYQRLDAEQGHYQYATDRLLALKRVTNQRDWCNADQLIHLTRTYLDEVTADIATAEALMVCLAASTKRALASLMSQTDDRWTVSKHDHETAAILLAVAKWPEWVAGYDQLHLRSAAEIASGNRSE